MPSGRGPSSGCLFQRFSPTGTVRPARRWQFHALGFRCAAHHLLPSMVAAFPPGYVFLFFCGMMVLQLLWVRLMVRRPKASHWSRSSTGWQGHTPVRCLAEARGHSFPCPATWVQPAFAVRPAAANPALAASPLPAYLQTMANLMLQKGAEVAELCSVPATL